MENTSWEGRTMATCGEDAEEWHNPIISELRSKPNYLNS